MLLKLAFKNFKRSKIRTMVIVISIATVIFLYSTIDLLTLETSRRMINTYLNYIGDFDIIAYKIKQPYFFNITNVTGQLDGIRDIKAIAPRIIFDTTVFHGNESIKTTILGIMKNESIGEFIIKSGNLELENFSCLITKQLSQILGVAVGDNITISLGDNFTFKISGVVEQKGKLPVDMTRVIFVNIETLWDALNLSDSGNILFIKLNREIIDLRNIDESISKILNISEAIQRRLGYDFKIVPITAHILDGVSSLLQIERTLLYLASATSILMAALLIALTTTINLEDRIREIGLLRAMGANSLQIGLILLGEYFLYLVTGIILGFIISWILMRLLFGIKLGFIQAFMEVYIPSQAQRYVLLSISIVVILMALYPLARSSRMSISEALKPLARKILDIAKLEKKLQVGAPIYSMIAVSAPIISLFVAAFLLLPQIFVGGDLNFLLLILFLVTITILVAFTIFVGGLVPPILSGLGKLFRFFNLNVLSTSIVTMLSKKRRLIIAFTMITLSLSAIYFVGILVSTQYESSVVSVKLDMGADVVVYPRQKLYANFTNEIESVKGVISSCPVVGEIYAVAGDLIQWKTRGVWLYGIDPIRYINASFVKEFLDNLEPFKELDKENMTVIISSGLASALSLGIGDELRLDFWGKTYILKIVGIYDQMPGFRFTRFSSRAYSTAILVSIKSIRAMINYEPSAVKFLVNANNSKEVANRLLSVLGKKYNIQVASTQEQIERIEEGLKSLLEMMTLMLNFSLGIAIMGLVIYIISSTRERRWEFALLRALGLSKGQLIATLYSEHLTLPALAFMSSLIISIGINFELNYMLNVLSDVFVPLSIPVDLIISVFLNVIIISFITSTVLIIPIVREEIAEVLRESEL